MTARSGASGVRFRVASIFANTAGSARLVRLAALTSALGGIEQELVAVVAFSARTEERVEISTASCTCHYWIGAIRAWRCEDGTYEIRSLRIYI